MRATALSRVTLQCFSVSPAAVFSYPLGIPFEHENCFNKVNKFFFVFFSTARLRMKTCKNWDIVVVDQTCSTYKKPWKGKKSTTLFVTRIVYTFEFLT
jgi:hypothetical protein